MTGRLSIVWAALALVAAIPEAFGQSSAASSKATPTVLELFTSQGCSSCPPADELLKVFVSRPNTIALSVPVDIWDHLGWRDTLATPKHSARQRAYAKALGTGNVYTPQMIVNGAAQAVGSQRGEIEKAIAKTAYATAEVVALKAVADSTRATIEIGEAVRAKGAASGTIWLVRLAPRVDVEVKRGENRGRTISYFNVVREISAVGMWSGKPMKIELPASAVTEPGHRCAVLLQEGETGRILGAAWME